MLEIHGVPSLSDNYIWVLKYTGQNSVYIVDPGDHKPVQNYLQETNMALEAILLTHQHWDHVTGVAALVDRHKCPVYGPLIQKRKEVDFPVSEGFHLQLWGKVDSEVIETPGHMPDHICWLIHDRGQGHLLCADTLFSAGCGRILGGDKPAALKRSLERLASLPPNTLAYPAHEYTLKNLAFAAEVEPQNQEIHNEIQKLEHVLAKGAPSLPTTIGREQQLNPFLRCGQENIQNSIARRLGRPPKDTLETFTELRRWKDVY